MERFIFIICDMKPNIFSMIHFIQAYRDTIHLAEAEVGKVNVYKKLT